MNGMIEDFGSHGDVGFYPGGRTVGYFRMESNLGAPTVKFGAVRKPSVFHQVMIRLLLGWRWIDDPQPGSGIAEPAINGIPFHNLKVGEPNGKDM